MCSILVPSGTRLRSTRTTRRHAVHAARHTRVSTSTRPGARHTCHRLSQSQLSLHLRRGVGRRGGGESQQRPRSGAQPSLTRLPGSTATCARRRHPHAGAVAYTCSMQIQCSAKVCSRAPLNPACSTRLTEAWPRHLHQQGRPGMQLAPWKVVLYSFARWRERSSISCRDEVVRDCWKSARRSAMRCRHASSHASMGASATDGCTWPSRPINAEERAAEARPMASRRGIATAMLPPKPAWLPPLISYLYLPPP